MADLIVSDLIFSEVGFEKYTLKQWLKSNQICFV